MLAANVQETPKRAIRQFRLQICPISKGPASKDAAFCFERLWLKRIYLGLLSRLHASVLFPNTTKQVLMNSTKLAAIASLLAVALADLPTITSTIVSSSCSLGPSTFKFSNDTVPVTLVSHGAIPSSSSEDVIYETDVVTNDSVFTTDRVVCNGGSCYTTTGLETWTTTTDTVDGILTTYVTHVPVSSSAVASAISQDISQDQSTTDAPKPTAVTKSDIDTTVVTITSCSDNKCSPTAVTTGLTVVTSTIAGTETIYTTYCPISSEESSIKPKKTLHSTTVATVTVCSENVCLSSAVTTGVTELTTTIKGVESIYTTYCPIESSTSSTPVAETTESSTSKTPVAETTESSKSEELITSSTEFVTVTKSESHKSKSPAASGTVNVITNNIVTQYSSSSSTAAPELSTIPLVSIYEGAGAHAAPVVLGLVPVVLALM